MTNAWDDILRSRYRLGARQAGVELDCLGTVLEVAKRCGLCMPDPWPHIRRQWLEGDAATASGFPSCWVRSADVDGLRDGDVLLFYGAHPWVAIIAHSHVWSADAELGGAWRKPVVRWTKRPAEVWRHDPAACSPRPARD